MKKVLLVVALVLTVGIAANAQFKFGVKAGVGFVGINDKDADMRMGATAGVLGQFKLGDKWAIQPEVLFNAQGSKYKGDTQTQTWRFNYIAVPVMAQRYISEGLSIEAGPQLGILLSSKTKYGGKSYNKKDNSETIEVALNAGVAYELTSIPIGFFARYSFGLTEVSKTSLLGEDLKNHVIQLGAFIKF